MPDHLKISLSDVELDAESREESATFGEFVVTANNCHLTEGQDAESRKLCDGPHVSGYPVAEWLAWNWWRIRWELGIPSNEKVKSSWDFAHCMSCIGEGYFWPNITVYSDGKFSFLSSDRSIPGSKALFRYLGGSRQTVSCNELESAVDIFVDSILDRLNKRKLCDTNLHVIWQALKEERTNEQIARFRKLEAQLGFDPDEADEDMIHLLLESAVSLGEEAFGEVAADTAIHGQSLETIVDEKKICALASETGFDVNLDDAFKLRNDDGIQTFGETVAWRVGECAAKQVREQAKYSDQKISNDKLAEFAGTVPDAISKSDKHSKYFSFLFDPVNGKTRLSLRSKTESGRRFELARLIGDCLAKNRANGGTERLFPATGTYSFRQKMQRAFAAELLSPFAYVKEMLNGDYSEERQNDVATYFGVSPLTIQTQLWNKGQISSDQAADINGRGAPI